MASDDGFLSRWSSRKIKAKTGSPVADETLPEAAAKPAANAAPHPVTPLDATPAVAPGAATVQPPVSGGAAPTQEAKPAPAPTTQSVLPTMDDVRALTKDSDFTRFVQPGVDPTVRNAAFKQLFTDPFFNEMDGLDIYIDDYSQPNPLPLSLARKLTSSKVLNLFETPEEKAARRAAEAAKERASAPPLEAAAPQNPEATHPSDVDAHDNAQPEPTQDVDSSGAPPENEPSAAEPANEPSPEDDPMAPHERPVP
jgi:hypothetical protein